MIAPVGEGGEGGVPHGPAHSRGAPSCRDRCCSKHFIFGSLKRLRGEPFEFYKLCLLAGLTDAGNVSVADEKQFPGSSAPPVFGGGGEEQMGVGSQTHGGEGGGVRAHRGAWDPGGLVHAALGTMDRPRLPFSAPCGLF